MLNYQVSSLVAAGDTVKTLIEEMTIAKSGRLIGAWCYAEGVAGITTIVPNSGIFELESVSIAGFGQAQFPLAIAQAVTSGASAKDVKVWPMNTPVVKGDKVKCYVTMDVAQTGANACRYGLVIEG